MVSKKIILTGSFGVGKTSLFNRYIYQEFSDKYLTTIGVKVNKKLVQVEGKEISLLVWDIAGEVSQDKVPASYFLGASGIVYVTDLTRPITFKNLESDYLFLKELLPYGIIKVVANKRDLVTDEQIEQIAKELPRPWDYLTSAKTGDNVENLFLDMAKSLLM
jgi:small GTP-binding protein